MLYIGQVTLDVLSQRLLHWTFLLLYVYVKCNDARQLKSVHIHRCLPPAPLEVRTMFGTGINLRRSSRNNNIIFSVMAVKNVQGLYIVPGSRTQLWRLGEDTVRKLRFPLTTSCFSIGSAAALLINPFSKKIMQIPTKKQVESMHRVSKAGYFYK